MVKEMREWFIDIFCGKLALVSWGESKNPPILLVHGYMDTAATYIPLLELLPDDYYYIGFDMPGHGKSDPFPPGSISQLYLVEIINQIVLYMKWKSFIYMGHSLGGFVGMIYNHLYPNKISKCIYLDPAQMFSIYYYQIFKPDYVYLYTYEKYYQNYERHQSSKSILYTMDEAISSIVRFRDFSEKQAAIVLSRSLVPAGGNKYALSWDPRSKRMSSIPLSEDMLYEIITRRTVPTLIIDAKKNHITDLASEFTANIMEKCKHIPDYTCIEVDGGHDVHVTNPELLVDYVTKFLRKKFRNESLSSKL